MKLTSIVARTLALAAVALAGAPADAIARESDPGRRLEASLLGGVQSLRGSGTGLPDYFAGIPAVVAVGWALAPNLALEGDVTWMAPVTSRAASGAGQDRKASNLLAGQVALRAGLPLAAWTPYLAAGAGAVGFPSNAGSPRLLPLGESQLRFALDLGAGTTVAVAPQWSVRADLREFVAPPSGGQTDPVWMERAALGLRYQF